MRSPGKAKSNGNPSAVDGTFHHAIRVIYGVFNLVSYRIVSYRMSCHVVPCHAMSRHVTSRHNLKVFYEYCNTEKDTWFQNLNKWRKWCTIKQVSNKLVLVFTLSHNLCTTIFHLSFCETFYLVNIDISMDRNSLTVLTIRYDVVLMSKSCRTNMYPKSEYVMHCMLQLIP